MGWQHIWAIATILTKTDHINTWLTAAIKWIPIPKLNIADKEPGAEAVMYLMPVNVESGGRTCQAEWPPWLKGYCIVHFI